MHADVLAKHTVWARVGAGDMRFRRWRRARGGVGLAQLVFRERAGERQGLLRSAFLSEGVEADIGDVREEGRRRTLECLGCGCAVDWVAAKRAATLRAIARDSNGKLRRLLIHGVRCVPEFTDTLISVDRLWEETGSEVRFADHRKVYAPLKKGVKLRFPFSKAPDGLFVWDVISSTRADVRQLNSRALSSTDETFDSADIHRACSTSHLRTLHPTSLQPTWGSRKQKSIALSTAEAEIIALSEATKDMVYFRKFLNGIGEEHSDPSPLHSTRTARRPETSRTTPSSTRG